MKVLTIQNHNSKSNLLIKELFVRHDNINLTPDWIHYISVNQECQERMIWRGNYDMGDKDLRADIFH